MEVGSGLLSLVIGIVGTLGTLISVFVALAVATDEQRQRMLRWAKTGAGRTVYFAGLAFLALIFQKIWMTESVTSGRYVVAAAYFVCLAFIWVSLGVWIAFLKPINRELSELAKEKERNMLRMLDALRAENVTLAKRVDALERRSMSAQRDTESRLAGRVKF